MNPTVATTAPPLKTNPVTISSAKPLRFFDAALAFRAPAAFTVAPVVSRVVLVVDAGSPSVVGGEVTWRVLGTLDVVTNGTLRVVVVDGRGLGVVVVVGKESHDRTLPPGRIKSQKGSAKVVDGLAGIVVLVVGVVVLVATVEVVSRALDTMVLAAEVTKATGPKRNKVPTANGADRRSICR